MTYATGAAPRTARRSARFVAWVRAWRAGLIPYDDVVGEIEAIEDHLVVDSPDAAPGGLTGDASQRPLREGLAELSSLHPDEVQLVLPAPGDPRGLPDAGGSFSAAAMAAGEGVLAGPVGLVPEVRSYVSGSGDPFLAVLWWRHPVPLAGPSGIGPMPAEAETELAAALARATAELTSLDVAQWRPELAGALADLRRHDDAGELPPVYNPQARRLYARASKLERVLALAGDMAPGGAVNAFEAEQRDAALRPLFAACRRALVAACNAPVDT